MKKKIGGNTNNENELSTLIRNRMSEDVIYQQKISNNVIVDNLEQSLSWCPGNDNFKSTDGCNQNNNGSLVNYLYLQNIRGGKLNNMTNKDLYMEGGCYTCPGGKSKLRAFSKTLIFIIPKLENSYKKGDKKKFNDVVKKLTTSSNKNKKQVKSKAKKVVIKKGGDMIDLVSNISYLGLDKNKDFVPANLDNVKIYTTLTSDVV
mgnify:CR=1 FL=1